jgi:hypothetical protein
VPLQADEPDDCARTRGGRVLSPLVFNHRRNFPMPQSGDSPWAASDQPRASPPATVATRPTPASDGAGMRAAKRSLDTATHALRRCRSFMASF